MSTLRKYALNIKLKPSIPKLGHAINLDTATTTTKYLSIKSERTCQFSSITGCFQAEERITPNSFQEKKGTILPLKSLIDEPPLKYENGLTKNSLGTVSINQNNELDVYLISPDSVTGEKIPDWNAITNTMKKHAIKKDTKNTLRLASRIEELKLNPPISVIECIIMSLCQVEILLTAPVILRLLEQILSKKLEISQETVNSLIWTTRSCTEPLIRYAINDLIRQYLKQADGIQESQKTNNISLLYGCFLNSLLMHGEIEYALSVYQEALNKGHSTTYFPVNNLLSSLIEKEKGGDVSYGIAREIMKTSQNTIKPEIWTRLFDLSVHNRQSHETSLLWQDAVVPGLVTPSNENMTQILQNFSIHDIGSIYGDIFRKSSLEGASQPLSAPDIASFLNAAATSLKITESTDPANSFIQITEFCYMFWPELRYKLLDPAISSLWKSTKDCRQFYIPFVEYTPSGLGLLEETKFRTFLFNLILRAHRNHWSPSSVFFVYRLLIKEGHVVPDVSTFEELLATALSLKNSKKLGKLIYDECLLFGIKPSIRMYQLLLRGSIRGSSYISALYYISKIDSPNTNLPKHLRQFLIKSFENAGDKRLRELLNSHQYLKSKYKEFPADKILSMSSRGTIDGTPFYNFRQDLFFSKNFKDGWDFEAIPPPVNRDV